MKAKEAAIREAAGALLDAINAGKEDGIVTAWPSHPDGLAVIALSENAKASAPAKPKQPAGGRVS